jgi:hypothetical protein
MSNILLLPKFQAGAAATIVDNADWRDVWTFQNSKTGAPVDLTGISFKAQLRASAADAKVALEMSTDNGMLVNGGIAGTLTQAVLAAKTRGLPSPCVFDMLAIDAAAGIVINLFEAAPATITVLRGVTR